jgi:molybdopterin-guanine dinucleotide biosynthesis protein
VLIEGLKMKVGKNPDIPKIAVVKTEEEAQKALETYDPIIAFSGPFNTQKPIP